VVKVARYGKVIYEASIGYPEHEPIFRLYGMSKQITAVAVLMLVSHLLCVSLLTMVRAFDGNYFFGCLSVVKIDEGKISLSDPVADYIPAFKDLKVYSSGGRYSYRTKDLTHVMRIKDLFLHTAGLSYGLTESPVDEMYRDNLAEAYTSRKSTDLDGFIRTLTTIPLAYQPETRWNYSVSYDVLGYIVQKVVGVSYYLEAVSDCVV